MQLVQIKTEKSLSATLLGMPIGEEQIFPGGIWKANAIRKKACQLKRKGYEWRVCSPRGMSDTAVTRIR